nr:phosphate ABC transporter ATP-binding protein [Rhabdothermincola salaria]
MPEPVLRFEGVHVTAADGSEILRGVDLDVFEARLTVLAGPSGSGKSTLLRLANRLEVPSAGRVLVGGLDTAGTDPLALRRRVGMVFQRPTPFPGSVRDNLAVAAPTAPAEELARALERVGLPVSLLERGADDLSGGEAQRMCLARTLLTRPDIVLMDEVTSSLDPTSRNGVEDLARRLVDDGITVVWVTHDLRQARRIADEVVVLVDGRRADDDERRRYLDQDDPGEAPEGPGGSPGDAGEAA